MHLSKLKTEALELEKKNLLYSPYNQRRIHFPTKYFIYSEEWPIVGFNQFNNFFLMTCNEANRGEYLMGHGILLSCNGVLRI
jgi:hypothetical protein